VQGQVREFGASTSSAEIFSVEGVAMAFISPSRTPAFRQRRNRSQQVGRGLSALVVSVAASPLEAQPCHPELASSTPRADDRRHAAIPLPPPVGNVKACRYRLLARTTLVN
jgi:hypothetical protein